MDKKKIFLKIYSEDVDADGVFVNLADLWHSKDEIPEFKRETLLAKLPDTPFEDRYYYCSYLDYERLSSGEFGDGMRWSDVIMWAYLKDLTGEDR